jgi:hypothetical protein
MLQHFPQMLMSLDMSKYREFFSKDRVGCGPCLGIFGCLRLPLHDCECVGLDGVSLMSMQLHH